MFYSYIRPYALWQTGVSLLTKLEPGLMPLNCSFMRCLAGRNPRHLGGFWWNLDRAWLVNTTTQAEGRIYTVHARLTQVYAAMGVLLQHIPTPPFTQTWPSLARTAKVPAFLSYYCLLLLRPSASIVRPRHFTNSLNARGPRGLVKPSAIISCVFLYSKVIPPPDLIRSLVWWQLFDIRKIEIVTYIEYFKEGELSICDKKITVLVVQ